MPLGITVYKELSAVVVKAHPQPETDDLIEFYHRLGKPYRVIPAYLCLFHGIHISFSWLKRRLLFLNLKRKGIQETDSAIIHACRAIQIEQKFSNISVGYHFMWQILKMKYKIKIKRDTVMTLLSIMDPEGVQRRRQKRLHRRTYVNKGPNFVWHLDGYDKLSPYGLCLHGCVDGYSRRIIWVKLAPSNHDPSIVFSFYLDAVAMSGGYPTVVRSDYGTENCYIATTQMALRHFHSDQWRGSNSFKYGKSTTNTRIEGLWSILRRSKRGWWIEKFKTLVENGVLNPSSAEHKHCLAYVYGEILKNEFVLLWNTHRMRANRNASCPQGIPDDFYNIPRLTGTVYYIKASINMVFREAAWSYYKPMPPLCPPEFEEVMDHLLFETLHLRKGDITVNNCDHVFSTLSNFLL